MTTRRFSSDWFAAGIFIAAGIPAAQHWYLARVLLFLWFAGWLLAHLQQTVRMSWFPPFLRFATLSLSLWALLRFWLPVLSPPRLAVVWLGILIYLLVWNRRETWAPRSVAPGVYWLSKSLVVFCLALFAFLWMMTHHLLSRYLEMPFAWDDWSSVTWGLLAVLLFYPRNLADSFAGLKVRFLNIAVPVLVILTLLIHSARYRLLSNELYASAHPQRVAERAFACGYDTLGARAVWLQTTDLLHTRSWRAAVRYMRSNWVHQHRKYFARAWRSHPFTGNDFFFLTTCFGSQLQLLDKEEAVDWVWRIEDRQIKILTSKGRLLSLSAEGIACDANLEQNTLALTLHPQRNAWAVLTEQQVILHWNLHENLYFPVLQPHPVDLLFHPRGNSLLLLYGTGEVREIVVNPALAEYGQQKVVFSALWKDSRHAQALTLTGKNGSFAVLDRYGGVYPHRAEGEAPLWSEAERMFHFNPQRPTLKAVAAGRNERELLLMNHDGWVYFVGSEPSIMRILFPADRAVALAPLPEDLGLIELTRNGLIIPYVLPQGAAILPDNRSTRLDTRIECRHE